MLHYQYVVQEGSRCCGADYEIQSGASPFFQWELDAQLNEAKWDELQKDERWFWHNINDALGDMADPKEVQKAQDQLRRKLMEKYPVPSSFERAPEVEGVQPSTVRAEKRDARNAAASHPRKIRSHLIR